MRLTSYLKDRCPQMSRNEREQLTGEVVKVMWANQTDMPFDEYYKQVLEIPGITKELITEEEALAYRQVSWRCPDINIFAGVLGVDMWDGKVRR